jgi:hypothetical protein
MRAKDDLVVLVCFRMELLECGDTESIVLTIIDASETYLRQYSAETQDEILKKMFAYAVHHRSQLTEGMSITQAYWEVVAEMKQRAYPC